MEIRSAARLVLLDTNGRVLLFRHNDGHGREFWATPGGGLEPGETFEQAARREAAEELGATNLELATLWTGHADFVFANRRISQTETFFLVKPRSQILRPEIQDVHRLEGIGEARWWSLDEIENSPEPLFPSDLASRIRVHLGRFA